MRGSRLPVIPVAGYVVVFDDVTDLAQAQRDAAWGEVARRLAHEIKNPLTPIQLSAERLERKLAPKLAGVDQETLADHLRRATRNFSSRLPEDRVFALGQALAPSLWSCLPIVLPMRGSRRLGQSILDMERRMHALRISLRCITATRMR